MKSCVQFIFVFYVNLIIWETDYYVENLRVVEGLHWFFQVTTAWTHRHAHEHTFLIWLCYEILGFHGSDCEDYHVSGCDTCSPVWLYCYFDRNWYIAVRTWCHILPTVIFIGYILWQLCCNLVFIFLSKISWLEVRYNILVLDMCIETVTGVCPQYIEMMWKILFGKWKEKWRQSIILNAIENKAVLWQVTNQ